MTQLVSAHATSSASPEAFFAKWIDHSSWSQWSPDSEWVKLDAPVAVGATGTLKPKGGPKTKFTITTLERDEEYTDASHFPGARLVFQHLARRQGDHTELSVHVTIEGPLGWLWGRILGGGFTTSVPADLDRLVAIVEAE
jgi:hypothetical protein